MAELRIRTKNGDSLSNFKELGASKQVSDMFEDSGYPLISIGEPVTKTDEFPIRELGEDEVVLSNQAMKVIDRHLRFERRFQGLSRLSPLNLCSRQKKSLASDLRFLTGSKR